MVDVKNIPILGKFIIIIAVFGALAIASVVYSTNAMQRIAHGYSTAIEHQAVGALDISRSSRTINQSALAIADLILSKTDEGALSAKHDLEVARKAFVEDMTKAQELIPDQAQTIGEVLQHGTTAIDKTCVKAIETGQTTAADADVLAAQEFLLTCRPAFKLITVEMKKLVDDARASVATIDKGLADVTATTVIMTYVTVLGGLVFVVLLAWLAISAWVSRPLKTIASTMARIAGGDLAVAVEGADRKDEIGPMARAVRVFQNNGVKLKETENEAAQQRQAADRERAANEATRVEIQRQQEAVVASIANGLDRLSKGDLTGRLSQVFSAEYEKLRTDFNATADSLQDALGTISAATTGISTGSDQIAQASDDLSRRTEQQAASLEETAAALNVITDTVKAMAANAGEAAKVVIGTRTAAESSGAIVQQAVEAMGKIKHSSNQISNIIGVIDEIAFQTNLLALNAGVEAARAGDAGRGFAVVASEVRGLAQRSAEAAKEIKALISASTVQVENGVVLVDKTGDALKDIVHKVAEMDALVRQISSSSQEQATGLAEINTAVGQMDQVVQQNAAMVEESTAAAHALKGESRDLTAMVGRFDIGDDKRNGSSSRANAVHDTQAKIAKHMGASPRHATPRPMMKTASAAVAKSSSKADPDWEEF